MKKIRVILSLVAFLGAALGALGSNFKHRALLSYYGHAFSGTISCTTGILMENNVCNGNGAQCNVRIPNMGGSVTVPAWLTDPFLSTACVDAARLVP